jgi:hypothetical protein
MTMRLRNALRLTRAASCFVRQIWLLIVEVPVVWYFMWRLKANALPETHPWVNTRNQSTWSANCVYRSPVRTKPTENLSDDWLLEQTGQFLARMVAKSCQSIELPYGPKRRMPHAVNYIHGAVHHNGLFVIFDNFADVIAHLRNDAFRTELLRAGRIERREITLLIRQRDYDPVDFAFCVGAVRNLLPWFSNGNGPTKRPVLWGNMAPFPAINLINGAWIDDLWRLDRGQLDVLARQSVCADAYFQSPYKLASARYRLLDRLQAWYMYTDVRLRGFRGQLFFANRHRIEPHRLAEYEAAGGYAKWVACHAVPFPLRWQRQFPFVGVSAEPESRPAVAVPHA